MSDNKKWVKAWTSLLIDPDFQNMRTEDKGRWFTLLLLLGAQGNNGMLRIYPPAQLFCLLLGVPSFDAIKSNVTYLEKCNVRISLHEDGSIIVTMRNWHKYQSDNSTERVRKFRTKKAKNVTIQEEKRREVTSTSTSSAARGGFAAAPPALAETARMSPEEMRAIRIKNLGNPHAKNLSTTRTNGLTKLDILGPDTGPMEKPDA